MPIGLLLSLLVTLLFLSAFFSGTETALMSLNRYRLRHQAKSGHRAARVTEALLKRPDRLIGLILLGNNAVNLTASALATLIAIRLGGENAIWAGTLILTVVVLIFAEVAPKTIAALHPARVAMPAALIYYPLLKITYPVVWLINLIANSLLRLLGVSPSDIASHSLSAEELRTVVAEAGAMVPRRHQQMLLRILDLDAVTVDDVMVPRQDIVDIDLANDWEQNLATIRNSEFHRLPICRDGVDNLVGVVQVRRLLPHLASGSLDEDRLVQMMREPYFVPEGTPLTKQLLNFEQQQRRAAFVVDEYGDVQGLVTTEDILQEIVGEFDRAARPADVGIIQTLEDSFIVDGSANVRQLNRLMNWSLPTDGPKTLNGLIVEELETIPDPGTKVTVASYPLEIIETAEHSIRRVRVFPRGSDTAPAKAANVS
ncbi:MAG: HlyC/CorC family transporter [Gammaproteobacteria bacterium]